MGSNQLVSSHVYSRAPSFPKYKMFMIHEESALQLSYHTLIYT
jgi:hypothetical protein